MKKKTKIWLGVGAFAMVSSGVAAGAQSSQTAASEPSLDPVNIKALAVTTQPAGHIVLAQGKGAGGEGSEGGEGGEGQIDPAAVDADPVDYGIALQVIAAHYHAGLLAYENNEQDAGAQMFAHGLSEVYVELEDILKKRGVVGLGDKLNAAVDDAADKKPVDVVRRRVTDVLDALTGAEAHAPKDDKPAMAVKTEVMAEMLERAAAQYHVSANSTDFESYLDGLGFTLAAQAQAKTALPWLEQQAPKKAAAIRKALDLATQAYPGIKRPAAKIDAGRFLAAASEARLAVARIP
ncbi:hypothetical protein [Pseudorhodoplanes sp.]|uniref:hypothetical protein n=1 Tax=Pseudorhodoplanes sp. TaxID=1934341 RepID=UPI002B754E1B|nr:hypothetical protein [Pseudorhodoplanes sp.]HWM81110.1 hypothetical protein [Pseudolabrys sp.]HWV51802.1 hypothetical protein [Pseudorhodoplanes sp.]